MIDKMSNTSRLVEKLKSKGMVKREVCPENRRQVDIIITKKGLEFIEELSKVVETEIARYNYIPEKDIKQLNNILDSFRSEKDGL